MRLLYCIFFLTAYYIINNETLAQTIKYNTLNCIGVVRISNEIFISNWNLKFNKPTQANLNIIYNNKKRAAPLRVSIKKNGDFIANGKWKSQKFQGSRFVRLNYNKQNSILTIGFRYGFRAEGKCTTN